VQAAVQAATPAQARSRVDEMCRRLLANTILEDYAIDVEGAERLAPSEQVR